MLTQARHKRIIALTSKYRMNTRLFYYGKGTCSTAFTFLNIKFAQLKLVAVDFFVVTHAADNDPTCQAAALVHAHPLYSIWPTCRHVFGDFSQDRFKEQELLNSWHSCCIRTLIDFFQTRPKHFATVICKCVLSWMPLAWRMTVAICITPNLGKSWLMKETTWQRDVILAWRHHATKRIQRLRNQTMAQLLHQHQHRQQQIQRS